INASKSSPAKPTSSSTARSWRPASIGGLSLKRSTTRWPTKDRRDDFVRTTTAAAVVAGAGTPGAACQRGGCPGFVAPPSRPAKIPAAPTPPPAPADSIGQFRIVLFAHPLCPCTRASLCELEESLARLPPDVAVSIVFVTAGLLPAEVAQSSTIPQAR